MTTQPPRSGRGACEPPGAPSHSEDTPSVGIELIFWAGASLATVREGNFADVRAASNARVAANDAKSNESLTLIARGSGGAFQEAWQTSADTVAGEITRFRDLDSLWQPYVDVHTEIRALDDGGQAVAGLGAVEGQLQLGHGAHPPRGGNRQ